MLHLKTMVVDGRWFTIGTTNFDNRSFAHNEENNTCGYDEGIARQLRHVRPATSRAATGWTWRLEEARPVAPHAGSGGGLLRRADLRDLGIWMEIWKFGQIYS